MTNNDILRRVRYALDLNNAALFEIFRATGFDMKQAALTALFKKEGDEGYVECTGEILARFLDGLIQVKRGPQEGQEPVAYPPDLAVANNDVLKKLRIALTLKEDDLLDIMKKAGFPVSKSELSALFRARGQGNFKPCGDQMLRNFLKGLTIRCREGETRG